MLVLLTAALASAASVDRVPQDFPTIQAAIDQGSAPVIEVARGAWRGATLTRRVALRGQGATITSGPRGRGFRYGVGITGAASGSSVRGFTFDCRGDKLSMGVYASRSRLPGGAANNVLVAGNTFLSCTQGVTNAGRPQRACDPSQVDGGSTWVIERNTFNGIDTRTPSGRGGGFGVYLYNVSEVDVVDNRFVGQVRDSPAFSSAAVGLAGCRDCVVASNVFHTLGATHFYTAVSNLGFYQTGAAASQSLLLADNDAGHDARPYDDLAFLSYDSFDTTVDANSGAVWLDHDRCGDGRLELIE